MHCNIILQYKPTKCTFPTAVFSFFLFFNVFYILNLRVYLQVDSCTYSYGMAHFTCISISCLVGRRVCSIHVKHVDDIKKLKY